MRVITNKDNPARFSVVTIGVFLPERTTRVVKTVKMETATRRIVQLQQIYRQ